MTIALNAFLNDAGIPIASTLIMRHTPTERGLLRRLSIWVEENPKMYNDYQSNQNIREETMLSRAKYLASFIGQRVGEALFVGIYKVDGWKEIRVAQFCEMDVVKELYGYGNRPKQKEYVKWFNLQLMPEMAKLKGKLVVCWPPPPAGRTFARWAAPNTFPVKAIHAENVLIPPMRPWHEVVYEWAELKVLPASWSATLKQWRAIYLVHDVHDGKNYVGSAYGEENLDARWAIYAANGHGGNMELRGRDPNNFRFSILELVSQSMPKEEVEAKESSWKRRLHTLVPDPSGLNRN